MAAPRPPPCHLASFLGTHFPSTWAENGGCRAGLLPAPGRLLPAQAPAALGPFALRLSPPSSRASCPSAQVSAALCPSFCSADLSKLLSRTVPFHPSRQASAAPPTAAGVRSQAQRPCPQPAGSARRLPAPPLRGPHFPHTPGFALPAFLLPPGHQLQCLAGSASSVSLHM